MLLQTQCLQAQLHHRHQLALRFREKTMQDCQLACFPKLAQAMRAGHACSVFSSDLVVAGDVIAALGAKEAHVPYRNSRLTYLLQPCLGGDAKTLMFVNLAPTADAAQVLLNLHAYMHYMCTSIMLLGRNQAF